MAILGELLPEVFKGWLVPTNCSQEWKILCKVGGHAGSHMGDYTELTFERRRDSKPYP